MGIFNKIKDSFNSSEFTIAPNKKLKTLSSDFLKSFGLSLVFYKGNKIADGDLTLSALNKITSKEINLSADALKIKASMKVGEVENLFDERFGVKVQIKDKLEKICVDNSLTIGDAGRMNK